MTEIRIELLEPGLDPTRLHASDACYDLRSRIDTVVFVGTVAVIPCGFKMALPSGWEAQIRSRSGLAAKKQVFILNSPGTVDASFRGEICAILMNWGDHPFEIKRGDRIAQMGFRQLPEVAITCVASIDMSTDRGEAGFGSTGVK